MGRCMIHLATDEQGKIYIQPATIVKKYDLSRTQVWRLLKRMREIPKYKKSFRDLGYHCKLVKKDDFDKFLEEQHRQYLKR